MRDTIWNPANTVEALQENVAIAAAHLQNPEGKYYLSPLTIQEAIQLGNLLWIAGYRKVEEPAAFNIQA